MEETNLFDASLAKKKKRVRKTEKVEDRSSALDEGRYNIVTKGKLTIFNPRIPEELLRENQPEPQQTSVVEDTPAPLSAPKEAKRKRDIISFDDAGFGELKKKKRKHASDNAELAGLFDAKDAAKPQASEVPNSNPLDYQSMLKHIYTNLMRKRDTSGSEITVVSEPIVQLAGTKKTLVMNLDEICSQYHRAPDHVVAFLSFELKTLGAVDTDGKLMFKARISLPQIKNAFKRYQSEYVQCFGCKSLHTLLSKDARMHYVRCEDCGAFRSVQPVKRFSDE